MIRRIGSMWLCLVVALMAVGCGGGETNGSTEPSFEVLAPELVRVAAELRDRAAGDSRAYGFLEGLTTEVGQRFSGSDGDRRAVIWAEAKLNELGFDRVFIQPVTVPRWDRGSAAGRITAPFPQRVVLVALGGSVGTPPEGVEAEVIEVASLEELERTSAADIEGKIVFINQRMRRARDGSGYGETVAIRGQGASAAAAKGAVAVLIRSVGTSTNRLAHTGAMRYADDVPRIPAAALSNPDADLLASQVERAGNVRFRLALGSRYLEETQSANVVAEIIGRERPEEIVLLAAHLDSWDLGTGAIDDGLGCAIVTETLRQLGQLQPRPRRTVRVLLAANEEFGLRGARAYAKAQAHELEGHVAALEADFGIGPVWGLRAKVDPANRPLVEDLASLLAPLDIELQDDPARGGADLSPLRPSRVPLFDLRQDGGTYFDIHHTANDTFDKVDKEALDRTVAAYATLVYAVAEWDGDLGRAPEEEQGG